MYIIRYNAFFAMYIMEYLKCTLNVHYEVPLDDLLNAHHIFFDVCLMHITRYVKGTFNALTNVLLMHIIKYFVFFAKYIMKYVQSTFGALQMYISCPFKSALNAHYKVLHEVC